MRARSVLIALFADIHANRQAFEACLAAARAAGADQIALLGDYVGYGADPEWAVDTVMELVDAGATAVLGNHDAAIDDPSDHMNAEAEIAIEWTRGELGAGGRKFLHALPLTFQAGNRLHVHADASAPRRFRYVLDSAAAARSLMATAAGITCCGHTHRPALYTLSATGKVTSFTPSTNVAIQLLPTRQWLAVIGSVGQPRDGNPAASYALFDTERLELTYRRTPYDIEAAADRIRSKGLPHRLADRLFVGR